MRFIRVFVGGATVIGVAGAFLLSDIPKSLDQMDKSAALIATDWFGIKEPWQHMASWVWHRPLAGIVILVLLFLFAYVATWGAEKGIDAVSKLRARLFGGTAMAKSVIPSPPTSGTIRVFGGSISGNGIGVVNEGSGTIELSGVKMENNGIGMVGTEDGDDRH